MCINVLKMIISLEITTVILAFLWYTILYYKYEKNANTITAVLKVETDIITSILYSSEFSISKVSLLIMMMLLFELKGRIFNLSIILNITFSVIYLIKHLICILFFTTVLLTEHCMYQKSTQNYWGILQLFVIKFIVDLVSVLFQKR